MPHERCLSPVPLSEFSCPALADPKARFCRSLASHSPFVKEKSAYPLDPKALKFAVCPPPECLALPQPADACVPLPLIPRRATQIFAHSMEIPEWAKKTRNEHRSASRLALQVCCYLISMVATPSNFFLMASASSLV